MARNRRPCQRATVATRARIEDHLRHDCGGPADGDGDDALHGHRGSTRLLQELGVEAYRGALAAHRDVIRAACASWDGYEVDYEGDSFFYAFSSARAAVSAAAELATALEESPIRVRVGLFQLVVPGTRRDFPRLRSLYRATLPVPATPLLGREAELAEVVESLLEPGHACSR